MKTSETSKEHPPTLELSLDLKMVAPQSIGVLKLPEWDRLRMLPVMSMNVLSAQGFSASYAFVHTRFT